MHKNIKIGLTGLAIVVLAFGAGSIAGADSVGIQVTDTHSNWQGPGFNDERSVFFERNKEVFDNGYYRYCTAANSNIYKGTTAMSVSMDLDCTPVFSPDGVPVGE